MRMCEPKDTLPQGGAPELPTRRVSFHQGRCEWTVSQPGVRKEPGVLRKQNVFISMLMYTPISNYVLEQEMSSNMGC